MPEARRLLAVPFVGKDVPSRASEFSHPDVVIGFAILAYRYEVGATAQDGIHRVRESCVYLVMAHTRSRCLSVSCDTTADSQTGETQSLRKVDEPLIVDFTFLTVLRFL